MVLIMENEHEAIEWYENKKKYMKDWREKNKDKINQKAREAYSIKKESVNQRRRELYDINKEKKQQYYIDNKDRILQLRHNSKLRTKNSHLQNRYGITLEQFNKMLLEQQNKCYICFVHIDETQKKQLCIDHCHNTGKVRKLLCTKCNTALGLVSENKEILYKMINYIDEHQK